MASPKKALITGITGQDGYYLAEFLLAKGYEVHGLARKADPTSSPARERVLHDLSDRVLIHEGDLQDQHFIDTLVRTLQPQEIYHLGGQKQSKDFVEDFASVAINQSATHYFLTAIRAHTPQTRFFLAGSSEMFGNPKDLPVDEATPFSPLSPYAISKVAACELIRAWRDRYGVFGVTGILFSHESPYRNPIYVTRKIAMAVAEIKKSSARSLTLGGLDARRDWGFAGDYVEAMWRMIQADTPRDYVIGTGENHSVQEFVEEAFRVVGLDWKQFLRVDPSIPASEIVVTLSNPKAIERDLGWRAETSFSKLVELMLSAELRDQS